ncbi:hypothetical protein GIX45_18490 [Erwinia sp. CPCC 100877]|nr:hypothetical protein [Erwinia sp. CPCC 100877]
MVMGSNASSGQAGIEKTSGVAIALLPIAWGGRHACPGFSLKTDGGRDFRRIRMVSARFFA